MKKLLIIGIVLVLADCNKSNDNPLMAKVFASQQFKSMGIPTSSINQNAVQYVTNKGNKALVFESTYGGWAIDRLVGIFNSKDSLIQVVNFSAGIHASTQTISLNDFSSALLNKNFNGTMIWWIGSYLTPNSSSYGYTINVEATNSVVMANFPNITVHIGNLTTKCSKDMSLPLSCVNSNLSSYKSAIELIIDVSECFVSPCV
ncbi:MAG TPA: hypothetical protein VGQ59_12975 [Cyclobacteriaceae bacterium]|jgi:hypothetical protein|nr:hypothetical protein [Cyclobacteriaceae bacterium]